MNERPGGLVDGPLAELARLGVVINVAPETRGKGIEVDRAEGIFVHLGEAAEGKAPAHGSAGKGNVALLGANAVLWRRIDVGNDSVDLFDSLFELVVGIGGRESELEDESVDLVDDNCDGQFLVHEMLDGAFGGEHDLQKHVSEVSLGAKGCRKNGKRTPSTASTTRTAPSTSLAADAVSSCTLN